MNGTLPACREVEVISFRGDRSKTFAAKMLTALDDERNGRGPGPSRLECVFFLGHTGISTDGGQTYFGFSPDTGNFPAWYVFEELDRGAAFPGLVCDDTAVFVAAQVRGLKLQSTTIILPDPDFRRFQSTLDAEKATSQYAYGYPDGDGDCNCVTWLERLGLPLLTGRLDEWTRLVTNRPIRSIWRFGKCV